jgi:hypothetical protein
MKDKCGILKSITARSLFFCIFFLLFLGEVGIFSTLNAQPADTLWSENWEGNWTNDWFVDAGTWEVGTPASGPGTAFDGLNSAGTVLAGNYSEGVRSRLIRFTKFTVPSDDKNPRLRFWHWFSFSSADYGYVQIKTENGEWTNVSDQYRGVSSAIWSYPSLDLTAYADSVIQIAFYFHSDNSGSSTPDVSSGWYIDDVNLVTGEITFNEFEDFESGLGDWFVDRGTWEVGLPSSGPGAAYSGSNSAGTRLVGNYNEGIRSRLTSPEFKVPGTDVMPRLRFWHWFSLSSADYGYVQIKTENGSWEDIYSYYRGTCSNSWTLPSIDLSAFADSVVQIGFYFQSDNSGSSTPDVSSGWYIDDVQIITGSYIFDNPEGFENGIGDWASEAGTWEVGEPASGPGSAHTGEICLGTNLNGNYNEGIRSRFISPPFEVKPKTDNPNLRFWHWFSFSGGDYGEVFIKTQNSNWQLISNRFSGTSSGVWSTFYADLASFADSVVQIGIYFHSDNTGSSTPDVSSGWYIDEINMPAIINHAPLLTNPIPDTTLTENNMTFVMVENLSYVFYDPDPSDTLSYKLSSDNSELIPEVKDDTLFLNASDKFSGEANIIIIASDMKGLSVSDSFKVDIITDLDSQNQSHPTKYELIQNYPNPFNPSTKIKFALPKAEQVKIEVYNIIGQKIETLLNKSMPAGYHEVEFNGQNLSSGVYLYWIEAGEWQDVKKMVLIR